MAKKIYIGASKQFSVTNLLDYNALSGNDGGYWGQYTFGTRYVTWSATAPTGGNHSLLFNQNFSTGTAEATYQLTIKTGYIKVHLIPSHKYYFSVYLRQPSVVGSFDCYWPIAEPPVLRGVTVTAANTWQKKSTIVDRASFSEGNYEVRVDFNNPTTGSALYVSNLVLVDLTATFDAGGEPDQAWCDANLDFNDTASDSAADTATITATRSVARRAKNLYIGVDGKARRVMKAYIGVGGKARICYENYQIKPNFSDNNWATIIYACRTKQVPSTWAVGNSKTMLIGGTNYQIDIIGKNHDDYADGSGKAPLTFQMHHCYNTKYRMNSSNTNSGGWNSCEMRTSRMASILAQMPQEAQSAVREAKKLTGAGGGSSSIVTSNDKLFLLSEIEIDGSATYSASGEGSRYAYYQNGGSTIKQVGGSNSVWWTRSPVRANTTAFCNTGATGNVAWGTPTSGANGVSVAFCF